MLCGNVLSGALLRHQWEGQCLPVHIIDSPITYWSKMQKDGTGQEGGESGWGGGHNEAMRRLHERMDLVAMTYVRSHPHFLSPTPLSPLGHLASHYFQPFDLLPVSASCFLLAFAKNQQDVGESQESCNHLHEEGVFELRLIETVDMRSTDGGHL